MTEITPTAIPELLIKIPPFNQLSPEQLKPWCDRVQLLRYRLGQPILRAETLPYQIAIILEGQARLLGYHPRDRKPITLQLLQPGDLLGWVGLVRGVACETAIASEETICLTLAAPDFLQLLESEVTLSHYFYNRSSPAEVYDLMVRSLQQQPQIETDLKTLIHTQTETAVIRYLQPNLSSGQQLDDNHTWYLSGGGEIENLAVGEIVDSHAKIKLHSSHPPRFIGFPKTTNTPTSQSEVIPIPYAPDRPPNPEFVHPFVETKSRRQTYPHVRGNGEIQTVLACFTMLTQYWQMPPRQDVIQRVLADQKARNQNISLQLCGAIAELLGIKAQLSQIPGDRISQIQTPALITWQDSFALVYETNAREIILGVPAEGIVRCLPQQFQAEWGENSQILLLQKTKNTLQQKFGLHWFIPSLKRYRKVLLEVFFASFFVQLFALANPLMIQVIIDRVIVQNSVDTLHVLGTLLVIIAIVEAVLSSLRTYLFVDTTNRIDLALGSEIIDHLLRLPLRYFEKRPVGELASRINELENIRQFLTGTALTVVLDAVFSGLYIVVMLIYSWVLTLVALATIPVFLFLTVIISPIIRSQLRFKAERNAETQSHLVEVLSGIQTVKAQNIELQSRWKWQEKYARYVSAGFKTSITSTTAGSTSNFLTKLSALLVLWMGAYLVLQGELTLGQLIAFRIISGYVTSPLLRLAQIWQNFQETALSLERLSDILDTPQEADEQDRENIPMPSIQGKINYENLSFRFAASGPLQLININLEIQPGMFVGIVGQSGSGKSTLTKLLPRLYDPNAGRILIDDYDISKVELYSLRRQIGIVPQDSLLFEGTIQENIKLTQPEASTEQIIEAAKIAQAHDFIMSLSNGYNTSVGERGSSLSGGQRQRIAIARTILQNPRLLILDEATSALDYDTERQVCLNLQNHCRDRTVLFITHRLSTIRNSDLILLMDQGNIAEQGTHDELMTLCGRYYCLFKQQDSQV